MEQKQTYLEALQNVPQLVAIETDPLHFLRCCAYNIWAAAQSLCAYWKAQKEIFGTERAFLPLTLTAIGTLTRDNIITLQAGYPAILPNTKSGQQVLFGDRRQCVSTSNATSKLRCCFYAVKKLAEDERAQTEGILGLVLLVMPRLQDFDRGYIKRMASLMETAFPLKLYAHCLC